MVPEVAVSNKYE